MTCLGKPVKALCTFGLVFAGSSVFSAQVGMPAQQEAAPDSLVLSLERNLCMQCHQAPEGVEDFLRPLAAPPLNHLGSRVTPSWLSAWLMDPQKMRPGTRMPNMLSGFPEDERRQIADDLAAYLLSMDGNEPLELLEVGADVVKEGEQLFTEIGCIACHAQAFADRELAAMTSVGSLRDQLLIPHQIRPSGLMPDMHLSEKEALSLASWLLREQQVGGPAKQQLLNGWKWHAYEYSGSSASGPDWETAEVFGHGLAEEIHPNYGGREDRYGLVFEGVLLVPEDGEYHFYVGSDDGSTLTIGEETLIDARFHQSHTRREQSHSLTAGAHPIRITYYEATGDDSLEAGWSGPGFEERPFAAEDVQHEGQVFAPLASLEIAPTADAQRGAQWFEKLRCAACHTSSAEIGSALNSGPAFDELVFDQGCLSEFPITGVPHYEWDSSERNELKQGVAHNDFLQARSGSTEFSPSKSAVRVATTMEAMQCTACHQRDGVGEPSEEQMRLFVGEGDLGEEGRIPPALTGVEAKLQPHWLAKVITNGEKVRPYMKTRMPSFGEQVGGVIARDLHANRRPMPALPQRDFDVAEVQMGREIAGTNGLACIVCHNMAGHKSPGIPGLDLATVADRLERSWFQQWLRNPHQMRSNTRMPVFWNEEGKSALTRLGEGDASVQINALWAYFSLGAAMPLPQGLITNPNVYSLIPMDRPLYFGTFMEGLSARVLTVGFPERVHLAFDQHNVRLAKVWRGEFMNGKGTWDGRAGELESPAGVEILDLPTGPPFAWSTDGSDWPTESGKDAGWRMVGQRRDADGNPTFRYRFEDVQVEESFLAKLGADGAYFERSFLLSSPQQATGLMRRWLDENGEIQVAAVEWTLAEGGYIAKIEEELKW